MIVPRSGTFISQDNEYSLYAVTTFKKHGPDFVHKCREKRWVPREYRYKEGGQEEEAREVDKVAAEEKKLWGEALRLGRTGWSEGVMAWVHVIVLRVFVETVLRYGLPLDFVCGMLTVWPALFCLLTASGIPPCCLSTLRFSSRSIVSLSRSFSHCLRPVPVFFSSSQMSNPLAGRPPKNLNARLAPASTLNSPTWPAMPLVATRKDDRRGTIRP